MTGQVVPSGHVSAEAGTWRMLLGVLTAVSLAVLVFVSWGDTILCTYYGYSHWAKLDYFIENPDVHMWFPLWHGGMPVMERYQPGYTLIGALFYGVPAYLAPEQSAFFYNVFSCLPLALAPPCFYFFLRSLDVSRRVSFFAAAFLGIADAPFGGPFRTSVLENGFFPAGWAFVLLVFALGCVLRALRDEQRRVWFPVHSIALAATVVTHPYSGLLSMLLVSSALLWACVQRASFRPLVRYLPWGALSVACSAFWVVPMLASLHLMGDPIEWRTLSAAGVSAYLSPWPFPGVVYQYLKILGLMVVPVSSALPGHAKVFLAVTTLIVALLGFGQVGDSLGVSFLANQGVRLVAYVALVFCLLPALALDWVFSRNVFERRRALGVATSVVVGVVVIGHHAQVTRSHAVNLDETVDYADGCAVLEWAAEAGLLGAFVLTTKLGPGNEADNLRNTFLMTGMVSQHLRAVDLNGSFVEGIRRPREFREIGENVEKLYPFRDDLYFDYVVGCGAAELFSSLGSVVFQSGRMGVVRVGKGAQRPMRCSVVGAREFTIDLGGRSGRTNLGVSFDERLECRSDSGVQLPTRKTRYNFVECEVPRGTKEVRVLFNPRFRDQAALMVSGAALLFCIAAALWRFSVVYRKN